MKKRMFNDRYGLTEAVLNGTKTITRSLITPQPTSNAEFAGMHFLTEVVGKKVKKQKLRADFSDNLTVVSPFNFYDVIAVAQCYRDIGLETLVNIATNVDGKSPDISTFQSAGRNNKMFVKAEYMPHRIRIDKVRVERLQDISEEDCLKEGIKIGHSPRRGKQYYYIDKNYNAPRGIKRTPREAFAQLIDDVMGKGTWKSNPWVWVYEFTLIQ